MVKKGMNFYDDKEKRKVRMRNHIARDLTKPKFRPRRVERKKTPEEKYPHKIWSDEINDD